MTLLNDCFTLSFLSRALSFFRFITRLGSIECGCFRDSKIEIASSLHRKGLHEKPYDLFHEKWDSEAVLVAKMDESLGSFHWWMINL